jgi:DNA-binding ferritin-like protein
MQNTTHPSEKTKALFGIPTDLTVENIAQISISLTQLLADVFALYLKTKSFHFIAG